MARSKFQLWVSVIVVLSLVAWFAKEGSYAGVQTHETDRVLEIERYPDEPLQLVNLRLGTQSIKEAIKPKFKDKISKWGTDRVKFTEKDDWVKRISITLRNTSDKPVYGLQSYLFFKPVGFPLMFSLSLTASKELRHEPLQPGAEIELTVNQGLLNQTLEDVKQRGANLSGAVVSFSLDTVMFSEELRWYRGKLLRRDSAIPSKWVPVDQPLAVKRNQRSKKSAGSAKVSFNHAASSSAPFVFSRCTQWNNSYEGLTCDDDISVDCIQRLDLDDNNNPGLLSHTPVSARCINDAMSGGDHCTKFTVHSRLQIDSNCQVCPDADNDGFQSASCGGSDCNDSDATINPAAAEDCEDGIDNDCDDCSCDMWLEGPIWQQSLDCSPCNDGVNNDCDADTDHFDSGCSICQGTPVLVDVAGNGFNLTNAANGVNFDLDSDGRPERLAWTVNQTDDAWLALDRNGDGAINNGTELFGNFTPQPEPPFGTPKNGFNALVEYDQRSKGGNGDGLITEQDVVFGNLLLWQDRNHNGLSEINELQTFKQLGLSVIECAYKESKRQDQHRNQFRYRAKVSDTRNTQIGRWAWDVILVREPDPPINRLLDRVNRDTTGAIPGWLQM
jgi:hypothetical protein